MASFLLGCSLVAGVLSVVMFQAHFILANESETIKRGFPEDETEKTKIALALYHRIIKKGYFGNWNLYFGMSQLILFLAGLILILIGLIK